MSSFPMRKSINRLAVKLSQFSMSLWARMSLDEWLRLNVIDFECSRLVKSYVKAPILVNIWRMWLWFTIVSTGDINQVTGNFGNLQFKEAKLSLLTEEHFVSNWKIVGVP